MLSRRSGVTLIELVVAVAVLAVLATAVFPVARMTAKRQKEIELRHSLRMLRTAIDSYKKAYDEKKFLQRFGATGYPPDLKVLVDGEDDATSLEYGKKIKFLRRVPRDPFFEGNAYTDNIDTWGVRSFASDADYPSEGDDVYDVYSKSEKVAIDGTKYNKW